MNFNILFLQNDFNEYTILTHDNNYIKGEVSPFMFYDILSLRLDNIYVWQGASVFALIDTFSNENNLFNYVLIPTDDKGRRKRCDVEAISYKDGAGMYYQRKLWLKTIKKGSSDRHKRLSSTNFINFSNFFGGQDFESVCKSFCITTDMPCIALRDLIIKFTTFIKDITGLELFKDNGAIKYWTIGALSKAFYLKLYGQLYGHNEHNNLLQCYQEDHQQSKVFEYDMRKAHLLTPGMLYYKDNILHKNCYKYDVNSLFPYIERIAPFLGVPKECSEENYYNDKYESIIYYKNIHLKKKEGMPAIFKTPLEIYKGNNKKHIFIEEIAFYHRYHTHLLNFYDIVDYEEVKYYRLCKKEDKAINEYVVTLYDKKNKCKNGELSPLLYPVVKYFLNNLHGKFAQLTIVEEYDYIKNDSGIINRQVTKLSDTWESSHFDYLRGAWIYSHSQAYMLKCLEIFNEKICKPLQSTLEEHIFYIDTDCIITDIAPDLMGKYFKLSDYQLGAFKVEACFEEFQVYAPKTYAGIVEGALKLTVAGMKKNEIIEYLQRENIQLNDILKYLSKKPLLPCTILKRTPKGCEYITEMRPLGKGFNIEDETEGVLYDCDNFII